MDIAINYLWQLRNRPLQRASFTPDELSTLKGEFEAFTNYVPSDRDGYNDIRAKHTDNDAKGHALGPSLFVAKVAREYTAFIEREIVNGPIGQRLRDLAAETQSPHFRGDRQQGSRSRVLIAGALPPMVLDQHLYRLQAKYVDQHADAPSSSAPGPPGRTGLSLAAISLQDNPPAPPPRSPGGASVSVSASTRSSPGRSTALFDVAESAEVASSVTSHDDEEAEGEDAESEQAKQTFESMLRQQPPICDLPTRVDMVDDFNAQLRAFCEQYPDVLAYVSINDAMRQAHPDLDEDEDASPSRTASAVSEAQPAASEGKDKRKKKIKGEAVLAYYCSQAPGDGANVHPTWERTYPLWLETLREVGVDVDSFPQMDLSKTEAQWTASKEERLQRSKYRTAI